MIGFQAFMILLVLYMIFSWIYAYERLTKTKHGDKIISDVCNAQPLASRKLVIAIAVFLGILWSPIMIKGQISNWKHRKRMNRVLIKENKRLDRMQEKFNLLSLNEQSEDKEYIDIQKHTIENIKEALKRTNNNYK